MTNLSSKNYSVQVSWSDEDGAFVASCREIPACVAVGEDEATAIVQVRDAIEAHLRYRRELGLADPRPMEREYSGRLLLRIPATTHRLLSEQADREGVSLNQLIAVTLAERTGERSRADVLGEKVDAALSAVGERIDHALHAHDWKSSVGREVRELLEQWAPAPQASSSSCPSVRSPPGTGPGGSRTCRAEAPPQLLLGRRGLPRRSNRGKLKLGNWNVELEAGEQGFVQ